MHSLSALALLALAVQQPPSVRFPTSCSPAAHRAFTTAVTRLHSFAFGSAADAFNSALTADSTCTIAYWGLALSTWGNPFAAGIKTAEQLSRGAAIIQRARAAPARTDRENQFINAAARLYDSADALDQPARLYAYRDAMKALVMSQPADTEAQVFYALSLAISAAPTDKTFASQLEAAALLDRLFVALPDHPGIAHYLIHSYDVPPLASRGLVAAGRYSKIAPAESHALHMPSHTFTRIGAWQQSIDGNVAAADAARRERSVAEELHANDYRMYALLQTGQDRVAEQLLRELPEVAARFDPKAPSGAAPPAAAYFAMAAIPARYALERNDWRAATQLEVRPLPFPVAVAITHFARGLGAARLGDTVVPTAAIDALQSIRERLTQQKEVYWSEQVEIQRLGALAWLTLARGNKSEAMRQMRVAADREDATDKNAMTPGPIAPARELLAEMLLQIGEPAQALTEFGAALRHEPDRFRSVAGAAKAAALAGDQDAARKYRALLLKIASRADTPGRQALVDARRLQPERRREQ